MRNTKVSEIDIQQVVRYFSLITNHIFVTKSNKFSK